MQNPNNFTGSNDTSSTGGTKNALKDFQLSGDTKEKVSKKYGEKIVLQVEEIIMSSYTQERNQRIFLNRALAAGRMDMKKFMDFFNIVGKQQFIKLNWKAIMIVNTIISRLVGRWMTKRWKVSVSAKDEISTKRKKEIYDDAEFYMQKKEALGGLGKELGVQLIPENQFIPDDKDELDSWGSEIRVPEEILYEEGVNGVFEDNGWDANGINSRKIKHDSAEAGLIGGETYADSSGKICIEYCAPENMFYSYSDRDDFADSSIKGVVTSPKISDIRSQYPKLTVTELYEIAKYSKQWTSGNKISYDPGWNLNFSLPFDDWNVDVARFTLRSLDTDRSLIKTAKDGSLYVDKPKKTIEEVYPGNEYVEKKVWNIYRGVYVRESKKILEWGLERNMIRPQSYEQIGEAYSPFCFYMYQNRQMRNLAVPEKIEEPVEMMILTRLKIQQLIAKMRPSGYEYDIDGFQEMDLGNGILTPLQLQQVTDQTGNVYRRSKDSEGNRLENPVRELPNAGSVPQLQALIETYNYHLSVLRDEVGINEFAEGQSIKPRVGVQNVQTSLEVSFNSTDYMNDACLSLTKQMAHNVSCLLHDSVEFESKEYNKLMKKEDVQQREFDVDVELLPTEEAITTLDNTVNAAVQAQPDLVLFLNPEKIKRIARDNVKKAEEYFRLGQKRAIKGREEQARNQSDYNAKQQQESLRQAGENEKEMQAEKIAAEKDMLVFSTQEKMKLETVTGLWAAIGKGVISPSIAMPVIQQLIPNITIPIMNENKDMQQGMMEKAKQEQAMAQEAELQQQQQVA